MSQMTDEIAAQLLAAVLAAPRDDAPRLAYAQHLSACGDPRGTFIQLQLRWRPVPEDYPLYQAAQKLQEQHGASWLPQVRGLGTPVYQRGFIQSLELKAADFADGAEAIFRAEPVEELTLTESEAHLARIAELPELARLRKVTLAYGRDPGFTAFVSSPHLRDVESFTANLNMVRIGGARAFANAAWTSSLRELNLGENLFGDEGLEAIAASPHLRRLERLRLGRTMTARGAQALAASPMLETVKELMLSWNALGDALAALASSPHLGALEKLWLHECALDDRGARALAEGTGLGNLRWLEVSKNAIGDEGAAALAKSTGLGELEWMDLGENQLTEAGAESLAAGAGMPSLQRVRLSRNKLATVTTEDWRDWNGGWVGDGPNEAQWKAFREKYGRRFTIE